MCCAGRGWRTVLTCTFVLACLLLVEVHLVHVGQFLKYAAPCLEIGLLTIFLVQCQKLELKLIDVTIIDCFTSLVVDRELTRYELCILNVKLVWRFLYFLILSFFVWRISVITMPIPQALRLLSALCGWLLPHWRNIYSSLIVFWAIAEVWGMFEFCISCKHGLLYRSSVVAIPIKHLSWKSVFLVFKVSDIAICSSNNKALFWFIVWTCDSFTWFSLSFPSHVRVGHKVWMSSLSWLTVNGP